MGRLRDRRSGGRLSNRRGRGRMQNAADHQRAHHQDRHQHGRRREPYPAWRSQAELPRRRSCRRGAGKIGRTFSRRQSRASPGLARLLSVAHRGARARKIETTRRAGPDRARRRGGCRLDMQGWSSWGIRTALRILNSRRISAWPRGTRWPAIAGRGARGRGIDVVFWVPSCRWLRARPSGTCRAAVTRRAAVGRTHDALVRSRQPLLVEQKLLVRRLATDIAVRPEKEAAHALPPHGGLDQQKYLGRIGKVSKNDRVILLVQVQPRAGVAAPVADHAQAPSVDVCRQSPLATFRRKNRSCVFFDGARPICDRRVAVRIGGL